MSSSENSLITVDNVSKCYRIFDRPHDRLLQGLWRGRKNFYREFWALKGVNFAVGRGETVGIIGRNGSGKSTLLQIISGTLAPTTGNVSTAGRVSGLLELGAGFNPEFTGRENVYLSAALLGLSSEETAGQFEQIAAFADIGEFLDQPLKFYSSGMLVRLGFAVQTALEPAVLVVDEALAVGDARFQKKCYDYIDGFRKRGGTILFVTHDTGIIVQICDWAMILEKGKLYGAGEPHKIAQEYHRLLFGSQSDNGAVAADESSNGHSTDLVKEKCEGHVESSQVKDANSNPDRGLRYGSQAAVITSIGMQKANHEQCLIFDVHEMCEIFFEAEYLREIDSDVAFGFIISNVKGVEIFGTKGGLFDVFAPPGPRGQKIRGAIRVKLALVPGSYFLTVAIAPRHSEGEDEFYDLRYDALQFQVIGAPRCFMTGIVDLQAELWVE
jgi:lipopolysaccharide transport system ATP-binding protein